MVSEGIPRFSSSFVVRAPDVPRHTLADQRMQRFKEFRWFHGISFQNGGDAEGKLRLHQARKVIRMVGSARRTDVASTLKA